MPLPASYGWPEALVYPLLIKLTAHKHNGQVETIYSKESCLGLLMDTGAVPQPEYVISLSVRLPLIQATFHWYQPHLIPIPSLAPSRGTLLINYIDDATISPTMLTFLDALLGQECLLNDLSKAEILALLRHIDTRLWNNSPLISNALIFALLTNNPKWDVPLPSPPAPEIIPLLNNFVGINSHIMRALIQSPSYAPMLRSLVISTWSSLPPPLLLKILETPRGLEPRTSTSLNLELAIATTDYPIHSMALQYFKAALSVPVNLPFPKETVGIIWGCLVEHLWTVERRPYFDLFFITLARLYPTYISDTYCTKRLDSDPFIGHLARYGSILGPILLKSSNVHSRLRSLVANSSWNDGLAVLNVTNYILGLVKWNDCKHKSIIEVPLIAVCNFAIGALGNTLSDKLRLFSRSQLSTFFSLWMRLHSSTLIASKAEVLQRYAQRVRAIKDFRIFAYMLRYLDLGLNKCPHLLSKEADRPWLLGIQRVYDEPHMFLKQSNTDTSITIELPQDWLREMRWEHLKQIVRALLYFTLELPFEESNVSDDDSGLLLRPRQVRLTILFTEAYNRWMNSRIADEVPRLFRINFSRWRSAPSV